MIMNKYLNQLFNISTEVKGKRMRVRIREMRIKRKQVGNVRAVLK